MFSALFDALLAFVALDSSPRERMDVPPEVKQAVEIYACGVAEHEGFDEVSGCSWETYSDYAAIGIIGRKSKMSGKEYCGTFFPRFQLQKEGKEWWLRRLLAYPDRQIYHLVWTYPPKK